MRGKLAAILCVMLLIPALMFAAGKIRGKVTDKESKEALVGGNVSIVGTTLGASTNVDGEYTILNIPAGTYTLKATFVGYAAYTISNVRVNNDLTTTIDVALSSEAVALQGVEVIAERPLVNKSATNAVRITTSEQLANLPVRGINNVIALSPGVVLQDNTVYVRGGRQDEVGFYLEGMSITNPMVGGRAVTLVQDAVEEIQVQAGGYNAEFGGANSGIIQQQLKTGTPSWKASLQYITDNIGFKSRSKNFDGEKTLGSFPFGYNEATGTLSGPVVSERFKFFGLFNYLFQRDANPQPFPGINLGLIRDPVSGDSVDLRYPAGAVRSNSSQQFTGTGTLTMDFNPLTVRLAGSYTKQTSFNAFNTHRNAGNISNLLNSARIEKVQNGNGAFSGKFTYLVNPTTFVEVSGGYFRQTQINSDPQMEDNFFSYGDSVANAQAGQVWQRKVNDRNIGRYTRPNRVNIFTFSFNTPGDPLAGYAKFKRENITFAGSIVTQIAKHTLKVGGDYQRFTMRNYSWGNEGAFALPGLFDQNAALAVDDPQRQTLLQILKVRGPNNFGYDLFGNEIKDDPVYGAKHPVFASGYIQDKIEYGDLVVNAGLRFDFINSDSKTFKDPAFPDLTIDKATNEINPDGLISVASFKAVSPRIGLSFPVSEKTVFHTQFGKFVQQSRLRDIYQGLYSTGANIIGGFFIGAPVGFDIRPTRTTQYEIGFTQQISDFASFDITGYYKDIADQIVYDQQNLRSGSQFGAYAILRNGDFATTKGVELTFNMRRQKRIQINGSISFNDARGTGSFPNSNRGIVAAPLDGVTIFRPAYVTPLEFNNAARGSLNLDYRWAKDDGGPVLEQLGASVLLSFNSGHPYTRGKGGADLEGDARDRIPLQALNTSSTPGVFQIDLRVDKSFTLFGGLNANVFIYVINLLDRRNEENVFLRTGSTTDDGYLADPSLGGQLTQPPPTGFGAIYGQMYRAINIDYYEQYQNAPSLSTTPNFFGPPRQIRLGVRLEY